MAKMFTDSKQLRDAGGIRAKICPATNNRPTRISRECWERTCKATRKAQARLGVDGDTASIKNVRKRLNYCLECQGKILPPGLEFYDFTGEQEMATKTRKGECWNCGATGVMVARSYKSIDGEICSTCANIYANVNQRLSAVVKAIETMGKGEFVVDTIKIGDESALEKLRENFTAPLAALKKEKGELEQQVRLLRDMEIWKKSILSRAKTLGMLEHESFADWLDNLAEIAKLAGVHSARIHEIEQQLAERPQPSVLDVRVEAPLSLEREILADLAIGMLKGEIRIERVQ